MGTSKLKRVFRKIGVRLGLINESYRLGTSKGVEMPSHYYDKAFQNIDDFQVPFYRSSYYPTWLVIVDRLRRYGSRDILDVGCGPGQFATLINDSGAFRSYAGIDFSDAAVKTAQAKSPQYTFRAGDARDKATFAGLHFDAIVCMEVLEHIENDFAVVSCFPTGIRCLMTVPNFPWRSHVRHFDSENAVADRYGQFFHELSVTRIKGVRSDSEQFFLMDGLRNSASSPASVRTSSDSTPM